MVHPNDANGDALRRLEAEGDDLTRARDIEFTVVFADEFTAQRFAEYFRKAGRKATVRFAHVKKEHPWDVIVINHMMPSHSGIGDFEQELQAVAETLGGYNDGWGCFSEPGKHLQ